MTLTEYLTTNTLISNTYNIFDYNTLKARLIARWGRRKILDVNIAEIAQNSVDVNRVYYQGLFAFELSPVKTWAETSAENASENTTSEQTGKQTSTTEHGGTITRANNATNEQTTTTEHGGTITKTSAAENTATGNSDATTVNNDTTVNDVWAFNGSDSAPANKQTINNNDSTEATYSDITKTNGAETETIDTNDGITISGKTDNTDTETINTNDQTTQNNTTSGNSDRTGNKTAERSGYNIQDALTIINTRFAAYDILIDDLIPLIIDFYAYHL